MHAGTIIGWFSRWTLTSLSYLRAHDPAAGLIIIRPVGSSRPPGMAAWSRQSWDPVGRSAGDPLDLLLMLLRASDDLGSDRSQRAAHGTAEESAVHDRDSDGAEPSRMAHRVQAEPERR